ncbi:hypothetical protein VKT23_007325 [Stygiomarasmius scandens]|uniref:Uncharacterized protein n=1 Tax=Marasmiellus scandens TaxID=2682957 RepID=A0ABR1JNU9_9AGAR
MPCRNCQPEYENGFADAGAYGSQNCSCTADPIAGPSALPPPSVTRAVDLDGVRDELSRIQAAMTRLESAESVIPMGSREAGTNAQDNDAHNERLTDAELVGILNKQLWHVDLKKVCRDPEGSDTEPEGDADDNDASHEFDFLMAPLKDRDSDWYKKRLDTLLALEEDHTRAQCAESAQERLLVRYQVELERARLNVMIQRAQFRKKSARKEKLAKASRELRRRLTETRLQN